MSQRQQLVEALETRRMLSVTWANRGKKDRFDAVFGEADAAVARQIVDAAIADWNQATPAAKVKLKITAKDMEPKKGRGSTLLGLSSGANITLDKDAAGEGWYFDKDLDDDSEFRSAANAYAGSGDIPGRDFYTVVAHEIGHSLGFTDWREPYVDGYGTDEYHTSRRDDLMSPTIPAETRYLISPYDIAHTKAGRFAVKGAATPPRVFSQVLVEAGKAQVSEIV